MRCIATSGLKGSILSSDRRTNERVRRYRGDSGRCTFDGRTRAQRTLDIFLLSKTGIIARYIGLLQSIGCVPVKYQVAHGQGLPDREKARSRLSTVMHVPFGGQSRGAAFSDDNQPSRMQIRNTVNRANNYNLTAHVESTGMIVICINGGCALRSP